MCRVFDPHQLATEAERQEYVAVNEEGWSFKCKECGSVELYVEHVTVGSR